MMSIINALATTVSCNARSAWYIIQVLATIVIIVNYE